MAEFGFWIFLAVLIASDCWVFSQGYDSLFQSHKTPAEKEIQRLKIEKLRRECERANAQGERLPSEVPK